MTSAERHEARYQRRRAKREARRAQFNEQITFERVFTYSHLYSSYKKCCRNVGWKKSTQLYRANANYNVAKTYRELFAGKFRSKGFFEFDLYERGKPRHIRAVHISERIVQRCLCDYALVPLLSRSFIFDNGACMEEKGTGFALDRLETHLHQYYRKYGSDGYVLTFDVHKFFDSISHEQIFQILDRLVPDVRLRNLSKYFVKQFGDVGLGLGSQISQICALASLDGLDHNIKEKARIRFYSRYNDDGYLIHPDKSYLEKCRKSIIRHFKRIGLEPNENKTQIKPLKRGLRFLKVRFLLTKSGRVVRLAPRKNTTGMRRKLKKQRLWVDDPKREFTFDDSCTSFASWMGHIQHCDSWRTQQRMILLFKDLFEKELKNIVQHRKKRKRRKRSRNWCNRNTNLHTSARQRNLRPV